MFYVLCFMFYVYFVYLYLFILIYVLFIYLFMVIYVLKHTTTKCCIIRCDFELWLNYEISLKIPYIRSRWYLISVWLCFITHSCHLEIRHTRSRWLMSVHVFSCLFMCTHVYSCVFMFIHVYLRYLCFYVYDVDIRVYS